MKLDMKKILPKDPSSFTGFTSIRILTALYLLVAVVRSCIHLFAEDGGAKSIAGVDTSVAGGENIIAIFHQWGAIQLILALLLSLLFSRYPGFTPLILMESAADTAKNRLVIAHEGGYNAVYSPFCGLFVLQQLSGIHKLDDPFSHTDAYPGQALFPHQKVEIDLAAWD